MRGIVSFLFVSLVAASAAAAPLSVVTVAAPAINCKFDPSCKVTVTDTAANFTLPGASGNAFLQSRTFPVGKPGTAGAGKYAYEYRLDLTQLVGLVAAPCITQLQLTFGSVVSLDYDGRGGVEQVFVTTVGGLGTVAPSSVDKTGNVVTFKFSTPVCSGSSPGKGDTSYFFGLASNQPARAVTATVVSTLGGSLSLNARAPKLPILPPPGGLKPRLKPPGR
jgi:hypothetical protein